MARLFDLTHSITSCSRKTRWVQDLHSPPHIFESKHVTLMSKVFTLHKGKILKD